jgi:hypothetical protein
MFTGRVKPVVLRQFMFAEKTCEVAKARTDLKEVEVTVLPTRHCANPLFFPFPSL